MNRNKNFMKNLTPFRRHERPYSKKEFVRAYEGGLTIMEIAKKYNIGRKKVQNDMVFFGVEARKAAPRNQRRSNNHNWKGDDAGYSAFHRRLYKNQPKKCEVCGTTDESSLYDWANVTGRYNDPDDYKRMCRSCHAKHDNLVRNFNHVEKKC